MSFAELNVPQNHVYLFKPHADHGGAWFDLFRTFDRKFGIIPSTLCKMAKGVEREGLTQALCPFAHRRD